MTDNRKILLSGIKPTGRPHIGNYFGAMRQFVNLQKEYQSFIMIADYHALTSLHDPEILRRNILDVMIDYLAIGLDPQKCVIFKQSDIPEHTELTWIFNCITTVSYLMRGHAYRDALAKNKEVDAGTFDYPMLMATDILLYNPDVVPVGADQKQHVEFARDTAEKFNRTYGDTFKIPEALILPDVGVIPGIDGQKMSKSYNNTIGLFAEYDEIEKAVMKIPTDSRSIENPKDKMSALYVLHKLVSPPDIFEKINRAYESGGMGYQDIKQVLIQSMEGCIKPFREKRKNIATNERMVLETLKNGGVKARAVAASKMQEVRKKVGVVLY
ncbi:MAG: tryptophanyl-tRNA synthetase [Parcubacteria group bacterium Gr01-1014_48]|nr:MAG: tryptophanyl-tRNA synthetase [Parcubacteria group bacterium Gr01-1014_48]